MKTSTKIILWAAGVLLVVLSIEYARSRPSPVDRAVIVNITGCGPIDLGLCHTIVEMDGIRLLNRGRWGEIGDTIFAMQVGRTQWMSPTKGKMKRYRCLQAGGQWCL